MNVTYHDVEQRSEAWVKLRVGRLTSGSANEMMASVKSGEAAGRRNLRVRLMLERLTNRSHERGFKSQAMEDGIEREADAVAKYEEITGRLVHPVGFISCDEILCGCSPDGLIGADGGVSIKCPQPSTHLDYLRSGVVPLEYARQNMHELWITGRQWIDFFSYNPDFTDLGLDYKLVRVERDKVAIKDYESKALAFLAEVEREVNAVRTMANLPAVLRASA